MYSQQQICLAHSLFIMTEALHYDLSVLADEHSFRAFLSQFDILSKNLLKFRSFLLS